VIRIAVFDIHACFELKSMPIYEFECPKGSVTERLVRSGTQEIECPKCHEKAKKVMSLCTFVLKGGGWAADGYSRKPQSKSN
jgi:putative FmdB family regulatory protein